MKHPLLRVLRGSAAFALVLPLAMCAPATYLATGPAQAPAYAIEVSTGPSAEIAARARTEHVVVVSIDGLRAGAIEAAGAETLQRLMREGAYSLEAKTILPSRTLPSHTSMLTGATPEVHGVTWNEERLEENGFVQVPTIFAVAREAGYRTAAFFSKPKFQHLMVPGSLDHGQAPAGKRPWMAGHTAESVEQYLAKERPNLLFVHFGEPDYAGHTIGWGGLIYRMAVRRADGAVARVIEAANQSFGEGNYTLIVTADHGGHGRTHGTDAHEDVTIPWIAWGKAVQAGVVMPEGIRTMDTAATALGLLGLELPAEHVGRPVHAAFGAPFAVPRHANAAP